MGLKPYDSSDDGGAVSNGKAGGNHGDGTGSVSGTRPGTVSGTFSDDESESDAGNSTDQDSTGGGRRQALVTERNRGVVVAGREGAVRHQRSTVGEKVFFFLKSSEGSVKFLSVGKKCSVVARGTFGVEHGYVVLQQMKIQGGWGA